MPQHHTTLIINGITEKLQYNGVYRLLNIILADMHSNGEEQRYWDNQQEMFEIMLDSSCSFWYESATLTLSHKSGCILI